MKIYNECCNIYYGFSLLNRWVIKFFITIAIIAIIGTIAVPMIVNGEEKKEEPKQEVLVCPECGKEAVGAKKYCSEDGTPIVVESSIEDDPVTKLREEALSYLYYLERKKISNSKDALFEIQERKRQEKNRWKQKELNELQRLIEALELTADYVDSGGSWEDEISLVVGYYPHPYNGNSAPVWQNFSKSLAKLEKFKRAKDLLERLKKKREELTPP